MSGFMISICGAFIKNVFLVDIPSNKGRIRLHLPFQVRVCLLLSSSYALSRVGACPAVGLILQPSHGQSRSAHAIQPRANVVILEAAKRALNGGKSTEQLHDGLLQTKNAHVAVSAVSAPLIGKSRTIAPNRPFDVFAVPWQGSMMSTTPW